MIQRAVVCSQDPSWHLPEWICMNAAESLTSQRKVSMFSSAFSITYLKMMGKELFRKGMGTDLSSKAEQNRAQKSFYNIFMIYIYNMAYF